MKSSKVVTTVAFLLIIATLATLAFTADANPLNTSTYSDERTDSRFALNEQQSTSEDDDRQNTTTQPSTASELPTAEEAATFPQQNSSVDDVSGQNTQNNSAPNSEVEQIPTSKQPHPPASHPQYADRKWPLSYIFGKISELV